MPRPFRFPLQRVLDYRKQLEDQAAMALAEAQMAYDTQLARANGLRAALEAAEAEAAKPHSAAEFWLHRSYKEGLSTDLARVENTVISLASEVNKRRREATARAKERKLLEKLKEKQKARHVHEDLHAEQQAYDEMATLRFQPSDL